MGKKGGDKRLKRMKAPAFWPIPRKRDLWAAKPAPGPHRSGHSLPLLVVVRDILGLARTYREARIILAEQKVKVDGKPRTDLKFPVGIMDVVEIPEAGRRYRMLPSPEVLSLHPVSTEEAGFKLCRIEGKKSLKGGLFQLNLHDGRTLIVGEESGEGLYPASSLKTFDVLKIALPEQQVLGYFSFNLGSYAIVVGGKNIGRHGKMVELSQERGLQPKIVTIEDDKGNRFQTVLEYVFSLGEQERSISLPEVS